MPAKALANMTDEELDAASQDLSEKRAAAEAEFKAQQKAVGAEQSRRIAMTRAEALKAELDELPEDVRAEVIGG